MPIKTLKFKDAGGVFGFDFFLIVIGYLKKPEWFTSFKKSYKVIAEHFNLVYLKKLKLENEIPEKYKIEYYTNMINMLSFPPQLSYNESNSLTKFHELFRKNGFEILTEENENIKDNLDNKNKFEYQITLIGDFLNLYLKTISEKIENLFIFNIVSNKRSYNQQRIFRE